MTATTILFRPVGAAELALVADTGFRAFPPRLPHQPIFYPVLTESYAHQIARDWNTRDTASGFEGHVLRFAVPADYLARYPLQIAGAAVHSEYWIPADELDAFNDAIVGLIELVASYSHTSSNS